VNSGDVHPFFFANFPGAKLGRRRVSRRCAGNRGWRDLEGPSYGPPGGFDEVSGVIRHGCEIMEISGVVDEYNWGIFHMT